MEEFTHEQLLLLIAALAALLTAIGPIMTTMGAAVGSWITSRRAAKREDLDLLRTDLGLLRDRVRNLETENRRLLQENLVLREYIATLRITLREHDIDVPALKDFDDDAWRK
jgi:hypothetical protein